MPTKQCRPGGDGTARDGLGTIEIITKNGDNSQPARRPFAVVMAPGLWRGCVVTVEPATVTHFPRTFTDHGQALAFAEALARLEGWPLINCTGEAGR